MKKILLLAALLVPALCGAEQIKMIHNSQTGRGDYITALTTDSIKAGTNITVSTNSNGVTINSSGGSGSPGGSTTQVQFNDAGSFGGDAGFRYDKTSDSATIAGQLLVSTAVAGGTIVSAGDCVTPPGVSLFTPSTVVGYGDATYGLLQKWQVTDDLYCNGYNGFIPGPPYNMASVDNQGNFYARSLYAGVSGPDELGLLSYTVYGAGGFQGGGTSHDSGGITFSTTSYGNGRGLTWSFPGFNNNYFLLLDNGRLAFWDNNGSATLGSAAALTLGSKVSSNIPGTYISNSITLKSPDRLSNQLTFTLPNSSGTVGQFLTTDGSTWTWATPSGGGGGYAVEPATVTFVLAKGVTASTVTVSSNTILSGATFYADTRINIGGAQLVNISTLTFIQSLSQGTSNYGTVSSSITLTLDGAIAKNYNITMGSDLTLGSILGAQDHDKFTFRLIQDTHGNRNITVGSGFDLGVDISTVSLSDTGGLIDYVGCIYDTAAAKCEIVSNVRGF